MTSGASRVPIRMIVSASRRRRSCAVSTLAMLAGLLAAGCASSLSVARPAPFPGSRVPPSPIGSAIADTALSLQGVPYGVGGNRPETGFDCSGLVSYVFARHQVTVPRTVAQQFRTGHPVPLDQLRAGDLIFFRTNGQSASHVGIAIGSRDRARFVHAPVSGGVVRVEDVDAAYWRTRVVGVRRIGPS